MVVAGIDRIAGEHSDLGWFRLSLVENFEILVTEVNRTLKADLKNPRNKRVSLEALERYGVCTTLGSDLEVSGGGSRGNKPTATGC